MYTGHPSRALVINNAFYEELKERWYTDWAHPIALLRKENEVRNPWILQKIETLLGPKQKVLDIGCGGGFLTNDLARANHSVTGIDLSLSSLQVACEKDETKQVRFIQANALQLPFANESFNVVCAMDLLEHVEEPLQVIREASRVLKDRGLFFFHTFNRNFFSWLLVIKGMEWCIPNTPSNIHLYSLFIKPKELSCWLLENQIQVEQITGLVPHIFSPAFCKSLIKRTVDPKVRFRLSPSLATGYMGFGKKCF